jgi:ketosteroid isomerase-like protein
MHEEGATIAVAVGQGSSPESGPRTAATPLRAAMIATWPLEVDNGFTSRLNRDPWVTIVRDSIDDYRSGRPDRARQRWHDDIRWRLQADGGLQGDWTGPEQIFNLHRLLRRETDNTFHQRLIALEGSRGPFVDAHLRTRARRAGRDLDIATLVVFELSNGRVRCVTELPGDRDAWREFWAG